MPEDHYEYIQPGQLLHLDIKKLARFRQPGHRVTGNRQVNSDGIGWEYIHLTVHDHSRVAFGAIEPDERWCKRLATTGAWACASSLS